MPRVPRVSASATVPPISTTPATPTTGGIRTTPIARSWRSHTAASSAEQRDRMVASRFLIEKVAFVKYIIGAVVEEAIGEGLNGTSDSANPEFAKRATELFADWADSTSIDIRKRFDFYKAQNQIARTVIADGECFALKITDNTPAAVAKDLLDPNFRRLQFQFLLRDNLGNGNAQALSRNGSDFTWDQGIKFDAFDRAVECRILKVNGSLQGDYITKPASELLHIYDEDTFNQHHGNPWLFQGHESGLDAKDMHAIRKFAAKIQSTFMGAIQTKDGSVPASMRSMLRKGTGSDDSDNGMRYLELGGGVVLPILSDGQAITFFQNREAVSFPELMNALWSELCFALGAPPEYLINLSGLGSASVRLVIGKIKRLLNRIRRMVRDQFCQPAWEFVIGDAIERGEPWTKDTEGNIVRDWRRVTWLGGGIDPSIDAGRDERAEQTKILSLTGTRKAYCANYGLDGDAVGRARIDEMIADIAYGKGISIDEARALLPAQAFLPVPMIQAMSGITVAPEPEPTPPPEPDQPPPADR